MGCCVPIINVTKVAVNTTTNVATLSVDNAPPNLGPFTIRFCNSSCNAFDPNCIPPCQNPQAVVQLSYTPRGATTPVLYPQLYNCPTGGCTIPNTIKLSQIVKLAHRCCGVATLHCISSYSASGVLFNSDWLPCPNPAYSAASSSVSVT